MRLPIVRYVLPVALAAALLLQPVSAAPSASQPAPRAGLQAAASGDFIPDDGVLPSQLGVTEETDPVFIAHYEEIAQNNRLVMYADVSTGLFAVKNKQSGKIWYSTPRDSQLDGKTKGKAKMNLQSQLLVYFIYAEDENTNIDLQVENSQVSCINRGTVQVKPVDNGIRVDYVYRDQGITVPVEYTLGEDYLNARILMDEVVEGDQCLLVAIHLLPTMGAGNWQEEGYLFVPDGCGALVNFNNNITMTQAYEQPVYGTDLGIVRNTSSSCPQTIHLPVFGTVTGNDALMGVITKGDAAANICVYNGNSSTGYNAVSSKAVLRNHTVIESFYVTNRQNNILQISHTPYLQDAYEVRYYVLSGDAASYVGMAERYRAYLIDQGLTAAPQPTALAVDMIGAVTIKSNFLGITYNKLTPMTTFAQAREVLDDLQQKGVDSLRVRYRGWSGRGLLNVTVPSKASAIRRLGGKKGLESLTRYCADQRITLTPEADFLQFTGRGAAARTPAGDLSLQYQYMLSVFETKVDETPSKLLKPTALQGVVEKYLPSYQKLGLDQLAVASIGDMVYSDFSRTNATHRGDLPLLYQQALRTIADSGLQQSFEAANAYALPFADYVYNAPIYSSNYDIFADDVPFYQIVLHGYVSYSAPAMLQSIEPEVTLLKAVETGSDLLYVCTAESAGKLTESRYADLFGATYSLWGDSAADQFAKMKTVLDGVWDKAIVAHARVADGVYVTTFDGGVRVAVNYTDAPAEVEGTTVDAMGFARLGGAA